VITFTAERRERFLTLLEAGRNVEEACADVGVSRSTISKWAARGRSGEDTDAAAFAERFDAVREGHTDASLTEADVLRLVERAARRGSVTAMKVLLDRFRRQAESKGGRSEFDALDEFDRVADLQRRHGDRRSVITELAERRQQTNGRRSHHG
jgi:hypothetical protein